MKKLLIIGAVFYVIPLYGKGVFKTAVDAENRNKRIQYTFNGMTEDFERATKELRQKAGLSFNQSADLLIDIQKRLVNQGLNRKEALKMAKDSIIRAKDVQYATGYDFDIVLESTISYIETGKISDVLFQIIKKGKKITGK